MLKRLEDYNKVLPILELYTAVQSEGSRAGYPTIVVRTSGCTHRCYFGEGGWCDSWYTSIHPEKGKYTYILDSSLGFILYSKDSEDILDKVKKELDL